MLKQGVSPEDIYKQLRVGRRTVYRWQRNIRRQGIRKFVRTYVASHHQRGRQGPPAEIKRKVWSLREENRHFCGEKIQCLLDEQRSVTGIYRILREKFTLRGKQKRPQSRGAVRKGQRPREVVQVDMVDFGELYAFTAIDTYTKEAHVSIQTETSSVAARNALEDLRDIFGEIEHIQKDGGKEFQGLWEQTAQAFCTEIRTSAPGQKNEQAFIERFNRSLRAECLGHWKYRKDQKREVQEQVRDFLRYYHYYRPHLALNLSTPSYFSMCHVF